MTERHYLIKELIKCSFPSLRRFGMSDDLGRLVDLSDDSSDYTFGNDDAYLQYHTSDLSDFLHRHLGTLQVLTLRRATGIEHPNALITSATALRDLLFRLRESKHVLLEVQLYEECCMTSVDNPEEESEKEERWMKLVRESDITQLAIETKATEVTYRKPCRAAHMIVQYDFSEWVLKKEEEALSERASFTAEEGVACISSVRIASAQDTD